MGPCKRSGEERGGGRPRLAMKCPYCAHLGDKVVDSRESKEGEVIRRRRECLECGKRFTSYERIDKVAYVRFASVYRHFRDISEFMDELKGLLNAKES